VKNKIPDIEIEFLGIIVLALELKYFLSNSDI